MKITNNVKIVVMIEDLQVTKKEEIVTSENVVEKTPFIVPESVHKYFKENKDSKLQVDTGKFVEKYIETDMIDIDFVDTAENSDVLLHFLKSYRPTKKEPELALSYLMESGLLSKPIVEQVVVPKKEIEHINIRTEETTFQIKEIENTKLSKEKIEENINRPDQFEINPLSDRRRVENLYEKIETHETESWEYYQKFVEAGSVTQKEAQKDYQEVQRIEKLHKESENRLKGKAYEKNQRAKKIATITERGAEYAISELNWYGPTRMRKAPNYMDKLKATDSLFEIPRNNEASDYLAMATDVTFSGLESDSFKGKVFKQLKHIRFKGDNQSKYIIDENGNPMRPFPAARTILHFEHKDARLLFEIIEKAMEPDCDLGNLREEYLSCPQKTEFIQQVFCGCQVFGKYAEQEQNPIFRQYNAMRNAIKELSWKEPEIKEMLKNTETNKFGLRLKELVEEYEDVKDKI